MLDSFFPSIYSILKYFLISLVGFNDDNYDDGEVLDKNDEIFFVFFGMGERSKIFHFCWVVVDSKLFFYVFTLLSSFHFNLQTQEKLFLEVKKKCIENFFVYRKKKFSHLFLWHLY